MEISERESLGSTITPKQIHQRVLVIISDMFWDFKGPPVRPL